MPNIAIVLKQEIARVARKELRAQTEALKKTVATLRSEVTSLKRRLREIEGKQRTAVRATSRVPSGNAKPAAGKVLRFSAKGLASHRQRLGLSAADVGLLVGASGQSVYHWESGKADPVRSICQRSMPCVAWASAKRSSAWKHCARVRSVPSAISCN